MFSLVWAGGHDRAHAAPSLRHRRVAYPLREYSFLKQAVAQLERRSPLPAITGVIGVSLSPISKPNFFRAPLK